MKLSYLLKSPLFQSTELSDQLISDIKRILYLENQIIFLLSSRGIFQEEPS